MTAYKRGLSDACLGVQAIGRHLANEERLLLSLSEAEQETLSALLGKLIAGL
jgi:hypothetical protein